MSQGNGGVGGGGMRILVFGAGAVGSTVAGWMATRHEEISLLARGETAEAIRERGILMYRQGREGEEERVRVKTIRDLSEGGAVDVVLLAVKNYSLEGCAREIREALGDGPIVVGLQNGVENQRILP